MNWIKTLFSTLRTWVFKKKLLVFSDRYQRDTQACFYCPEMCRFACPVAENLKDNSVTPRSKMSLLHYQERGVSLASLTGKPGGEIWYLTQCSGCGRCTEFCFHEIDVASNLRNARKNLLADCNEEPRSKISELTNFESELVRFSKNGTLLLAERGRKNWWVRHEKLLARLKVDEVSEFNLAREAWGWGVFNLDELEKIRTTLSSYRTIWVESPELAWFLVKEFKFTIKLVWQEFFGEWMAAKTFENGVFHESYHLSRLLPREGVSVLMDEKGNMPFNSAWRVLDCGAEGFYHLAQPQEAKQMAKRWLADTLADGRKLDRIVCQSLSCVEHLKASGLVVEYWLDKII